MITVSCLWLHSKNGESISKTFKESVIDLTVVLNSILRAKKYVFLGERGFQADMPPRKYFDKESFNFASFASDVQYWSGILNSNLAVVSK